MENPLPTYVPRPSRAQALFNAIKGAGWDPIACFNLVQIAPAEKTLEEDTDRLISMWLEMRKDWADILAQVPPREFDGDIRDMRSYLMELCAVNLSEGPIAIRNWRGSYTLYADKDYEGWDSVSTTKGSLLYDSDVFSGTPNAILDPTGAIRALRDIPKGFPLIPRDPELEEKEGHRKITRWPHANPMRKSNALRLVRFFGADDAIHTKFVTFINTLRPFTDGGVLACDDFGIGLYVAAYYGMPVFFSSMDHTDYVQYQRYIAQVQAQSQETFSLLHLMPVALDELRPSWFKQNNVTHLVHLHHEETGADVERAVIASGQGMTILSPKERVQEVQDYPVVILHQEGPYGATQLSIWSVGILPSQVVAYVDYGEWMRNPIHRLMPSDETPGMLRLALHRARLQLDDTKATLHERVMELMERTEELAGCRQTVHYLRRTIENMKHTSSSPDQDPPAPEEDEESSHEEIEYESSFELPAPREDRAVAPLAQDARDMSVADDELSDGPGSLSVDGLEALRAGNGNDGLRVDFGEYAQRQSNDLDSSSETREGASNDSREGDLSPLSFPSATSPRQPPPAEERLRPTQKRPRNVVEEILANMSDTDSDNEKEETPSSQKRLRLKTQIPCLVCGAITNAVVGEKPVHYECSLCDKVLCCLSLAQTHTHF